MFREIRDQLSYHNRSTREFARHDFVNVYEKIKRDLSPLGLNSLKDKNVLDLGCGQRFPFSLLAASDGATVTALDINYCKPDNLVGYLINIARSNGLKRSVKSTIRRLLFDQSYYKELERASQRQLRSGISRVQFVVADPTKPNYPLPGNCFEFISSIAVLEHVSDVPGYFKEVSRLLKPNGIFYGIIHNFYSLSGGHNLQWAFPDKRPSKEVPPWDHLRNNLFPIHVYLNRLHPDEYRRAASADLQVLVFEGRDITHDPGGYEGEQFLTEPISAELDQYSRNILLTRSYCIICRKR